jgi:hypothetical protein
MSQSPTVSPTSGKSTPVEDALVSKPNGPEAPARKAGEDENGYLHGRALFFVLIGILLGIFLIALDQTIVANALPVIASKFNALDELAWIPSAFLLTQASFLLVFGQLPQIFPLKWVPTHLSLCGLCNLA